MCPFPNNLIIAFTISPQQNPPQNPNILFGNGQVNTWVDGNGSSELNFQQTKVNTWVDGNGSSELNFQQTKVNTWVDGYSCSECHSTSKPGCFIGTSVHQHIGTSTAVSISTSPHYHISTLIGCFRLGGRFALVHRYIHTLVH